MLRRFLSSAIVAAGWMVSSHVAPGHAVAADALTVGSDAPALDVEHWVQDGKGKFKPVTKFEAGKVYVVEFWATWCGPCIMSMPHLAETQTKYASKGVQIVSISDEDLETVEKFLEREVRGQEPKGDEKAAKRTYRDLTSVYCLTTDPDRSSYETYMEAAGQNGIPTAFIVGKDRKIEWIGHPMEMDEPLEQVVAGKWDRAKFAEEFKAKQEMDLLMQQVGMAFQKKDFQGAVTIIEEGLKKAKSEEIVLQLNMARLTILLRDPNSVDKVADIAEPTLVAIKSQPGAVNQASWMLVSAMEEGKLKKNDKIIKAALAAMEVASKAGQGDEKAAAMDTLAHLQFMAGNVDAAIKTQKAAIELASPEGKKQLGEYLKQLEEAKSK